VLQDQPFLGLSDDKLTVSVNDIATSSSVPESNGSNRTWHRSKKSSASANSTTCSGERSERRRHQSETLRYELLSAEWYVRRVVRWSHLRQTETDG
jgi:hypothetical protein